MPQNPLGTHNNQRATHRANRLTPQQMKNLRWSGWVYHLHIVLSTELQEALEARRGVLWTLPFEAVRQQHSQTRETAPLVLTAGDKLIDHHLGTVGKITKLRFPDN